MYGDDDELSAPPPARGTAAVRAEVVVTGRLDRSAVPGLDAAVDAALRRGSTRVVLDVAQCHYADAAGIALLLDLHRRSRRIGSSLALRAPSPRLRRLLEIARVDQVLTVDPGPAEQRTAADHHTSTGHHTVADRPDTAAQPSTADHPGATAHPSTTAHPVAAERSTVPGDAAASRAVR
ncbi:STAS domain-containing protein [Plantactinospora sp. WMMB334]|uniref:STAS domain-containing protein n=1 Tax=Plantactinospora sp. WMMB334 TaxID=3404119 RepID=UPI003B944CCA